MHLKELELYGFKSFGDRVKIGFHPRLTAIVGPNGSGKSNIVDSVRWLLGDQSYKSLRVPSSEEVIFKGADTGVPFNFSHVSMVIDLGDEGEVKFERRYHRSGENEYILNGRNVRLKDIRSLLSSKGFALGSLSILSQGQIDTILSLVPTDRRIVLEEVAQITHFKDNKTRILRKLDATRDNLNRLEDILREVDTRLKELEEQAEAARKHGVLSQRHDELEIMLSFKEVERLVKNIQRNITELEEREQELFSLRKEAEELDCQKTLHEKELDNLRNNLESELKKNQERSLQAEKSRSAMDIAKAELDRIRDSRNATEASIRKTENEIQNSHKKILTETANLNLALEEKKKAQKALDELFKYHVATRATEDAELAGIEKRSEEASHLKMEIDLTSGKLMMIEERVSLSSQTLEEGEEAFKDRSSELETMKNRLGELEESNIKTSGEIDKKEIQKELSVKLLDEVEDEISRTEQELDSLKDHLIEISSELKILGELERKLAGYQSGVKRVLEARSNGILKGIIGPVFDLIKTKSGYEKAIESVLGSRGQYILVEKFDDGLEAIEYLKKNGGRATFISIEDFTPALLKEKSEIPKDEGFLGYAIEQVSIDEIYQKILEKILGDVLIFSNLKSAHDASRKYGFKHDIVTLDGDVHRHGGIFSGGSTEIPEEGPLVRRSRIEELTRQKNDGEINVSSTREKLSQAGALRDEHKRTIKSLDDEILKLKETRSATSSRSQYLLDLTVSLERELAELGGRRDKTEKEISDLIGDISALREKQSDLEKQLDEIAKLESSDQAHKDEILAGRSLREDEINRLRIHVSSREQEEEHLKSKISSEETKHEELVADVDSLRKMLLEKLALEEDAESRHIRLKYKSEIELEHLATEGDNERILRSNIDDKREELAQTKNRVTDVAGQIEQTDAKRESQSLRIARMETELVPFLKKVSSIENVKNEYPDLLNIESDDFNRFLKSSFINDLPPRKQIADELAEIKSKLDEIGEVNVLAERDFENYQRRQIFLRSQQDDLVKGADELMVSLNEIELESKKAFKEVFDKTKANFEEIFQELYPTGKAELLLTNPDDLLESGLEIKVKFPGKKELDLLQFSGGERSIIAIAFLFAVLRTKPPSFVFLDEVEAALDDVNVDKFISLMKKFSDKFQFIVVTHNKLTMEYSRELWGVTMRKGGMSQIVNISLDDWIKENPQEVRSPN